MISKVADRLAIVFATRTGSGPTGQRSYGFPGSETDLIARGALPAGWLTPAKARLLLWALLRQGWPPSRIADEFARRGGHPGGGQP
jgi:L-asparaginase